MSRERRQQYMLRTEASEQEAVIEDYVTLKKGETMPIKNNQVLKR